MRRKSGNPELCTGGRGETPMACTSSQSPMAVSASKAKRPSPGNRTRPLKTSEPPDADPHVRWWGRGTAALLTAAPIPIRPYNIFSRVVRLCLRAFWGIIF